MTGVRVALVVSFSLIPTFGQDTISQHLFCVDKQNFSFFFFFILHIWLGSPIGPKNVLFIVTSYRAKKVIIHLEASLHGYRAVIQGTQLKKKSFTRQRKNPSGYLAMLHIHTDQKREAKSHFQEYFSVKFSVYTNGWDTGESILSLISRGHDISIDWDRQIVRSDILSLEACLSEKDTRQIQGHRNTGILYSHGT